MGSTCYSDLVAHVNHAIECVVYAKSRNVAIECVDCCEVLLDFDGETRGQVSRAQRRVLDLAARGKLWYATSYESWEPGEGDRRQPFDLCEERGWIEIQREAEPVGQVMRMVPVVLTVAGHAVRAAGGDEAASS